MDIVDVRKIWKCELQRPMLIEEKTTLIIISYKKLTILSLFTMYV